MKIEVSVEYWYVLVIVKLFRMGFLTISIPKSSAEAKKMVKERCRD